jgi:signal transduction histidine kinase
MPIATKSEVADRERAIEQIVDSLIEQIRNIALRLRPHILDDLGLHHALKWLIRRFTLQTRIDVDFVQNLPEEIRVAPDVETAAFRIVQEALTNVSRHARVDAATVSVLRDDKALTVRVSDEGAGFDVGALGQNRESMGVSGMRERAALVGGALVLEAAPGRGTRVVAVLPFAAPSRAGESPGR